MKKKLTRIISSLAVAVILAVCIVSPVSAVTVEQTSSNTGWYFESGTYEFPYCTGVINTWQVNKLSSTGFKIKLTDWHYYSGLTFHVYGIDTEGMNAPRADFLGQTTMYMNWDNTWYSEITISGSNYSNYNHFIVQAYAPDCAATGHKFTVQLIWL